MWGLRVSPDSRAKRRGGETCASHARQAAKTFPGVLLRCNSRGAALRITRRGCNLTKEEIENASGRWWMAFGLLCRVDLAGRAWGQSFGLAQELLRRI